MIDVAQRGASSPLAAGSEWKRKAEAEDWSIDGARLIVLEIENGKRAVPPFFHLAPGVLSSSNMAALAFIGPRFPQELNDPCSVVHRKQKLCATEYSQQVMMKSYDKPTSANFPLLLRL
jgi:hypothetical protein